MAIDRNDWLAQVTEEPIDPDIPICDPHHHLWDHPESVYLAGDLLADSGDHNVVSTVFIECESKYREDGPEAMKPVGETEFVEAIAEAAAADDGSKTQVAAGIVSYADLTLGDGVAPVLEAHQAASPDRFRGIRHASGWHQDEGIRNTHTSPKEGLLLDDDFRKGFACLQRYGLSFDAWFYHAQLDELVDLARAFPDQPIILDHFGGPLGIGPYAGKPDEVFADWKRGIDAVSTCPNVVVKIGGLAMPINGYGWHKADRPPTSEEMAERTAHYYLHTIEKFGVERCMFESNFPVDRQSCSYTVLWNSFKRITSEFSADERAALFHDTAARVYRVES